MPLKIGSRIFTVEDRKNFRRKKAANFKRYLELKNDDGDLFFSTEFIKKHFQKTSILDIIDEEEHTYNVKNIINGCQK